MRDRKVSAPFIFALILVVLLNILLFSRTALSIICIVPHSDAYRKSSGIPANICTTAAETYSEGGGKKTKLECPAPTTGNGTCGATSVDVIWQYTGFTSLNPPTIDGYAVYVRVDPTKDVLTSTSCYFPTTPPALPSPLTKADFDPWFGGGPISDPLCNVDSGTAGWKVAGADPAIAISGEDSKPQANFLMMTLNFTSMKDGGTIYFDYDAGEPAVYHTSGAKNVSGCTSSTFNVAACKCPKTAEATDGCFEMDVVTHIPLLRTCPVTGPSISWGAVTGCPAAGTSVPTVNFAGSQCKSPGGVCGSATCVAGCAYTVKSGGATIGTGGATSIALPSVPSGTAVSYTIDANCGWTQDGVSPTVTSTAPSCDTPPSVSAATIMLNGNAYDSSSAKYVIGEPIAVTGSLTDIDDTVGQSKVFAYYGTDASMNMTGVPGNVNSAGSFTAAIPGAASSNLGTNSFRWGLAFQDKDGTGPCFDPSGNPSTSALCSYFPSGLILGSTTTAARVDLNQFTTESFATLTIPISPAGWSMIGLSVRPDATSTEKFAATTRYKILWWNPAAKMDPIFGKYEPPKSPVAGQAMWIKPRGPETSISLRGTVIGAGADYEYVVGQSWNQIANPFNKNFPWTSIQVKKTGQTYSRDEAVAQGWIAATPYYYDGRGWRQLGGTASESQMIPGRGFFMYAIASDLTLVYSPSAMNARLLARGVVKLPELRVRLSASTPNAADADNFITLSQNTKDGFDGEDLLEPPPGMDSFVSLYFPHNDWGAFAGRYANDTRPPQGRDATCGISAENCKVWDIEVETNDSSGPVSLSWSLPKGASDIYIIRLADIDSGAQINMASATEYRFTPGAGAARRLQVTTVRKESAPDSVQFLVSRGWNAVGIPALANTFATLKDVANGFDTGNAFSLSNNLMKSAIDNESAAIGRGRGFLLYNSRDDMDVIGTPVPLTETMRLPLKRGWELIGNPYGRPLLWGDNMTFECGGAAMTLGEAIARGAVGETIFEYDGEYEPLKRGDLIGVWKGAFVKMGSDCALNMKY